MGSSNGLSKSAAAAPEDVPVNPFDPYRLVEARADAEKETGGVSTGFDGLDLAGFRLQPGQMYALAGRPGEGKTALRANQTGRIVHWASPHRSGSMGCVMQLISNV